MWTTAREKDVQLDSQQAFVQGYCNFHRLGEGRIDHDVPSCGRNHIGIEDKQKKDVLEWIGDSGGKCKRDNFRDSD